MATARAYYGVDMTDNSIWYGYITTASSTTIRIEDGWLLGTYKGSFSYDYYGNVYGKVESYKLEYAGTILYTISDIDRNAYTFSKYVDSGDAMGLYAYVLSGADKLTGSFEDDRLLGFSGNDVIAGLGGHDDLAGGAGHDRLDGGSGLDLLLGGSGNDRLHGGSSSDLLSGGKGNDTIRGGTGKDILYGDSGQDTFEFWSTKEAGIRSYRDEIRDFEEGLDLIDVSRIDAQSSRAGDQAFKFIGSKAFTGTEGQLRYENGVVSGDINGDRSTDFQIALTDLSPLHASDFIL